MATKEKKVVKPHNKECLCDWEMWGVPLFGRHSGVLLSLLSKPVPKHPVWIATVNPEFVMNALKDRHFMSILQERTSVNVVDGVGLVWANEVWRRSDKRDLENHGRALVRLWHGFWVGVEILQGRHRETLIGGVDLMDALCRQAQGEGKTVFFYGGWGDRSARTAVYFKNKYPGLKVVGAQAEDFDFTTKVDYLFVARAMKKQELWIDEHFDELNVKLVMGLGRSFDYYSGDLKRAPLWVRRMGFEWLFSLLMEPKRWKRQLELPKFIWKVIVD